ncbi:MAG TPA: SMP-30/gluconolactonase/LRE family protein [Thermoanaerobaculia bacterium]|nr:SMP-30/gluconolactonase/LRE family protein [Thermoanaerobaculia bacterium]
MKRIACLLVFALGCATRQQPEPPPAVDTQTREMIKTLTGAIERQPANLPYIYLLASYHDKAGETGEVVRWLARLDELGWEHGVSALAFKNSSGSAFRNVAAKLASREPAVSRATTAFTMRDQRDLVPEGIVWDPVDDVFYVSGIHARKVLRVTPGGRATDFVTEDMLGGLGMKIDRPRRVLWVISTTTPEMRGYVKGEDASQLAAYDLRTGVLLRKIDAAPAMLNDLTILLDGTIFATDMGRHKVVRLARGSDTLEEWADGFSFPNGITNDGTNLYVADFQGIHQINLANETRTAVDVAGTWLGGIDGLDFREGTLIGIQNAVGNPRVVRVHLGDRRVEVLESKNELFELPTTGAIRNSEYWFIANPGLRSFDEDGTIWPESKLQEPVMLKIPL